MINDDMTQEETYIREHDSGRRPFTVPEGYFEGFTERMMTRLKAEEQAPVAVVRAVRIPLWRRAMRYAAVGLVAMVCVGGAWFYTSHRPTSDAQAQLTAQMEFSDFNYSDDDLDAVLDYELVDNAHIAYYLTEAY